MAKRTMPPHRQRRPNEGYVSVPIAVARELWESAVDVLVTNDFERPAHFSWLRLREAVGSLEDVLSRHARRAP